MTHSNSDDGFHDLIVYHHRCGSSLRVGQSVGQNSTNDLALVHHLSTNSRLVSQQVSQSAGQPVPAAFLVPTVMHELPTSEILAIKKSLLCA